MQCKDNSINYLNKLGYNVVRLPREGIMPLLVVGKHKEEAKIFGPIQDLVQQPSPVLPSIDKDLQVANISGLKSSQLEFSIGINFLQLMLSALNVGNVGIDVAYKTAKTIEFALSKAPVIDVLLLLIFYPSNRNCAKFRKSTYY
ncbi:hypothetical protein VB735_12625 [Halotia wernerae UHCC 0503]|nr:hypothetical protein [Halotia wernerae UHCC 0503]